MTIFSVIKELPEKYQIISSIRSVELKLKLAERIGGILKLLDFFDIVEPDPKTRGLVDSFFSYFNQSITDTELLNTRTPWLLSYSNVVYNHLLTVKHGPILTRETVMPTEDTEFMILVSDLVETIGVYQCHPNVNQPIDYYSFQIIDQIISLSKRVQLDLLNSDYTEACELIISLTQEMNRLTKTGSILVDDGNGFLTTRLRQILFYTDRFVSYKGISL